MEKVRDLEGDSRLLRDLAVQLHQACLISSSGSSALVLDGADVHSSAQLCDVLPGLCSLLLQLTVLIQSLLTTSNLEAFLVH